MYHKMRLFMMILMIVMTISSVTRLSADSDISSNDQNIERLAPKQLSPLSKLLSKRTIPLLREAFKTFQVVLVTIFPSLPPIQRCHISPALPTPGAITRYRKKTSQTGEKNTVVDLIVSKTSVKPGTYAGIRFYDKDLVALGAFLCDETRKVIAVLPYESEDIELEGYIASKGEIKGSSGESIRVYGQKSIKQEEGVVTIPEATLKSGIYSAFNGPDSAVILDNDGGLITVLIGNGDNCDLYIPTEAEVTGTLIQDHKKTGLPKGGKASFSEASLKAGPYKAVNGLDCAFILDDKENVLAILSKEKDGFELHIACTAEITGTSPDSSLKPGTYKAFRGSDYAVILDEEFNILATSVFVSTDVNIGSKVITTWGSIKTD